MGQAWYVSEAAAEPACPARTGPVCPAFEGSEGDGPLSAPTEGSALGLPSHLVTRMCFCFWAFESLDDSDVPLLRGFRVTGRL